MNQEKLNFQFESLKVDWLGFNIKGFVDLNRIATYLSKSLGFNSILIKNVKGKSEVRRFIYDDHNKFQVSFRQYEYDPKSKSFWVGTKMDFSGNNAEQIYSFIKKGKLDWDILNLYKISLSRLDINYISENKLNNKNDHVEIFMQKSCERARSKNMKATWTRESNGKSLIMKIGSRTSPNYYRVYQKEIGVLKFELELKHEVLKPFQQLLFSNSINEFEYELSKHFYSRSFKSLNLNHSCMNWLLDRHRKQKQKKGVDALIFSYIKNKNINLNDKKLMFNLFNFLSFIKNQESSTIVLDDQVYYLVKFSIINYTRYLGLNDRSHYQRKKVLQILQSLQTLGPVIENFDDFYFKSSIMIPYVKVQKEEQKWIGKVAVGEQLYFYEYPFQFHDYFRHWKNNYQFQVKIELIEVISTLNLKKEFHVEEFINQFNISNSKKTELKHFIVETIDQLIENQVIRPQIKINTKDNSQIKLSYFKNINLKLITKSKIIYLYEYF